MKNRRISILAAFLAIVMLVSAFSSCGGGKIEQSTDEVSNVTTEKPNADSPERPTENPTEQKTEDVSGDVTDATTTRPDEATSEEITDGETKIVLEGEHAELILNANKLANGIQSYIQGESNELYVIENQNMTLAYKMKGEDDKLLSGLYSSSGKSYIENTYDVFLRMKDGGVYYASRSPRSADMNIYRFGYYYQEIRLEGQNFINGMNVKEEKDIPLDLSFYANVKKPKISNGRLRTTIISADPYLSFAAFKDGAYSADEYKYIRLTIKTDDDDATASILLAAGEYSDLNPNQIITFDLASDGEEHTYTVYLGGIPGYKGNINELRLDFEKAEAGRSFEVSDLKLLNAEQAGIESLQMARVFHAYSDKLHHELQVSAIEKTEGIDAVGIETVLAVDTVEKLIVKDANGIHETLDAVDWQSVEYLGFDVKEAGIFGFILPVHETAGAISVTLEDDFYVVRQEIAPYGGVLLVPNVTEGNKNDIYLSHRVYTDENHDFDEFINQAEAEREPLTSENISINAERSDSGAFLGYNAVRGVYEFYVGGTGFNEAFYDHQNKYFGLDFTVTGDKYDRRIYITVNNEQGTLETAVIADENMILLPVPIEVIKNFGSDGSLLGGFRVKDDRFSEAIFPIVLSEGKSVRYNLLHLYQNWGSYPISQISCISWFTPYYHLSTGVTESNCITFWNLSNLLPDHRSASSPMWVSQPQHTSGGRLSFFEYVDKSGSLHNLKHISNYIGSYGPIYADVEMNYVSDDGKIAVSLSHAEMSQTDENRAYYTMRYEFIEDVSFDDFKNDFTFYTMTDNNPTGTYKSFGYLDENNKPATASVNASEKLYVLGDQCPYFDYFDMGNTYSAAGSPHASYVNLSFLILDSSIVMGGKEITPNFVIREGNLNMSLSLNLENAEFKAGDKITIYAIIMPWGYEGSVYDSEEFAPDENVRKVRENSLLDRARLEAIANCEITDSVFVPSAKSTNGKSAEFRLRGGENAIAIRVYGFKELSALKVYEKTDGEWKLCDVSSANTPDNVGNAHKYDGYSVFYDGDGTYSYAFNVTQTGGGERHFKVEVSEENFDAENTGKEVEYPFNVYLPYHSIAVDATKHHVLKNVEIFADEDTPRVALFGSASLPESAISMNISANYHGEETGEMVTGQYVIIKYRMTLVNPERTNHFEVFAGTVGTSATGRGDAISIKEGVKSDGEWHIIVVDLASFKTLYAITPNENGEYSIKYCRFDVFNGYADDGDRVDLAYFAIHDDLDEIAASCDVDSILISSSGITALK